MTIDYINLSQHSARARRECIKCEKQCNDDDDVEHARFADQQRHSHAKESFVNRDGQKKLIGNFGLTDRKDISCGMCACNPGRSRYLSPQAGSCTDLSNRMKDKATRGRGAYLNISHASHRLFKFFTENYYIF